MNARTAACFLWLSILCAGPGARADERAPPILPPARTEALVDLPKGAPYVGEMLLLRLRSFIAGPVAAHEIRQPDLINFDWQQFGRDAPVTMQIDGVSVKGMERVIAIYPRRAGVLTIEPFVRHVTLLNDRNERYEADFASEPITVEVRAPEGLARPGGWWLPAKAVRIADDWRPNPEAIGLNETARRTITIEAEGLTADRLPPPPLMRAPGVIVFAGPQERQTIATDSGPLARAVYRYDVRPVSSDAATMPAIRIPWFDTGERKMREAAIPERKVAFVDPAAPKTDHGGGGAFSSPRPAAAAGAAFLWTLAAGFLATSSPGLKARLALYRAPLRKPLAALRGAARRDDLAAFRAATLALARAAPQFWRAAMADPALAQGLAALDAALYAQSPGGREAPRPLPPLARSVEARLLAVLRAEPPAREVLAPLEF